MTPIDPDEARRRILEELARGEYQQGEGFIAWLLGLIDAFLSSITGDAPGSAVASWILGVAAALVMAVLVLLVMRRTGLLRRSGALSVSAALDGSDDAGADELRVCARTALESGRHDDAVVLALRSLARDLEERTLLEVSPGMTAHELAAGAARPFPDLRRRLEYAATAFDMAAYSRRGVAVKQAEDAVRLVEYVSQSRPDLAEAAR